MVTYAFAAGAMLRTPLWELPALSQPPSWIREGTGKEERERREGKSPKTKSLS